MKAPVYRRMFGYDTARLPNAHLASLEQGVTCIEEAKAKTGLTIGYPGWGVLYHLLLAHLDRAREEVIIETGSNYGCTTIILAQALCDAGCRGRVISIELDADNAARARKNLELAGLAGHAEVRVGDSRAVLPDVVAQRQGIRAVFLDASHLHDDVMAEFETLLPHLSEDALVLFDNTYAIADEGEDSRVNGALKSILDRHGGNLINLAHVSWYTPGLAIWQREPAL